MNYPIVNQYPLIMGEPMHHDDLIDAAHTDMVNSGVTSQTARDQLRAAGLERLVESNPDYISANAGYFVGTIRAYVDEIEYWTNKGGPDMRRSILEYTERIQLIFAYQDQLREEYEAKMVEAYDLCYMRGGD